MVPHNTLVHWVLGRCVRRTEGVHRGMELVWWPCWDWGMAGGGWREGME